MEPPILVRAEKIRSGGSNDNSSSSSSSSNSNSNNENEPPPPPPPPKERELVGGKRPVDNTLQESAVAIDDEHYKNCWDSDDNSDFLSSSADDDVVDDGDEVDDVDGDKSFILTSTPQKKLRKTKNTRRRRFRYTKLRNPESANEALDLVIKLGAEIFNRHYHADSPYSSTGANNKKIRSTEDVISFAFLCMIKYKNLEVIQAKCSHLLTMIPNFSLLPSEEIVKLVLAAMRNFPLNYEIQSNCCLILDNLISSVVVEDGVFRVFNIECGILTVYDSFCYSVKTADGIKDFHLNSIKRILGKIGDVAKIYLKDKTDYEKLDVLHAELVECRLNEIRDEIISYQKQDSNRSNYLYSYDQEAEEDHEI